MILLLVLAAMFALVEAAQAKDWSKITIATTRSYMPYNGTDAAGKPIGYEIDLANDLCARMQADCTVIATSDWPGLIPSLIAGKYDAIMAAMNVTPKRLKVINFSRTYAQAPSTFAVRANSPLASMHVGRVSLDDMSATDAMVRELAAYLEGKRVGVQIATNQVDLLNKYFRDIVGEIVPYVSIPAGIRDLQAGRIDAMVQLRSYYANALSESGGDQLALAGPLMTGGVLGHGSGVGLRKGDTELKDLFDKAIGQAQADGTLRRLTLKWFKTDISPPN